MTSAQPLPHPGVRFPPPLIYLAVFAVGWLLQREWPLGLPAAASRAREFGALALGLVGLTFMLSALATFRRKHTSMIPNRPASALATSGPYRFTRNPMYVSLVAFYLAAALAVNSWWPVFLLPIVIFAIQRFVISREERYLTDAFPTEYPAYCQRVRRWL